MERLVRIVCALSISLLSACSGCGDDPPPTLPGIPGGRTGFDVGPKAEPDGGIVTPESDAGERDAGAHDAAEHDAGPDDIDGGQIDAGDPDAGTPDTGVPPPADSDHDNISDEDEGFGVVDTDGDSIVDSMDPDSDDDGIPDIIEAGDADLFTAPVDSDGDGLPDFRDRDADADGILDATEGTSDVDGDGFANYRDVDSDGDFLLDRTEGEIDTDGDGTRNFLDIDSDNDGILDRDELRFDPDRDGLGAYIDLDSDGDSIDDAIEGRSDVDGDAIPNFLDTDSDGDDIDDVVEGVDDFDLDSIPNFLDTDSDGDLIADREEGLDDPDNDSRPNFLDTDSDGDTVFDLDEAGDQFLGSPAADEDFDGVANYLDLDSDGDTIRDEVEGNADPDADGRGNFIDIDADGDFVLDGTEAGDLDLQTDPVDTDHDSIPDYVDIDSDNDTIWDRIEASVDSDEDGTPDRIDQDSDNDGISDTIEAGDADPFTMPWDTDRDGAYDFRDIDSDDDGLLDANETGCPGSTNRLSRDSDTDGFPDPAEQVFGSDPCSAVSGIDDFFFELPPLAGTDSAPLDFTNTAIDRADFAINLDTTGSMGGEITNLRSSLSTVIIPGAQAIVFDPAFAVTSFQDFPIEPFGSAAAGDRPFVLGTRVTTDSIAAQTAVNALVTNNGSDLYESGVEALFQVATGAGTQWGPAANQRVAAFDPNHGRVAGVADGTIGGVGFRSGALPIVVHVTDAPTHFAEDYAQDAPQIVAADVQAMRSALTTIGARTMTIASSSLPRPADPVTMAGIFGDMCQRTTTQTYGRINSPAGSDVDWFILAGAASGQTLTAETNASRIGSPLDPIVGVYNGAGVQLARNNDMAPGLHSDSRVTVTLSGTGPFYVAVSAYNDANFNQGGGLTSGFYMLEVTSGPNMFTLPSVGCTDIDHGDSRQTATRLVTAAAAANPASASQCQAACEALVADDPIRVPYGIASATEALIPACAWDEFGAGRPAGCAANECCTGIGGAGTPTDGTGLCPLAFEISANGSGIGQAVVTGIESMVRFASFTITTSVRGDPIELGASGLDTSCFIQDVVPATATPPNACAPTPNPTDRLPPSPALDSFEGVVPGTALVFTVSAENRSGATGLPCAVATSEPQLYRAFIDVVADGVTVVDTRDVIIIIPPSTAGGS